MIEYNPVERHTTLRESRKRGESYRAYLCAFPLSTDLEDSFLLSEFNQRPDSLHIIPTDTLYECVGESLFAFIPRNIRFLQSLLYPIIN